MYSIARRVSIVCWHRPTMPPTSEPWQPAVECFFWKLVFRRSKAERLADFDSCILVWPPLPPRLHSCWRVVEWWCGLGFIYLVESPRICRLSGNLDYASGGHDGIMNGFRKLESLRDILLSSNVCMYVCTFSR